MDQLIRWRDGRYFRIFGSRYELKARGSDILLLRPLTDKTKQSERMTVTPKSIRTAVATIQD
jgi:hypothetical protein